MTETQPASPAEVLLAELSAALPARRSALEFERHYMAAEQAERVNRGLFQIRVAEARLKPAPGEKEPSLAGLVAVAVAEAESLEEEAEALLPVLAPELAGRQIGVLSLVSGLFHLARLGEGRARAYVSFARLGKHLLGFEEALELAPENELFFLALRRFRRLLDDKSGWSRQDLDWLRLRAKTCPGRLRLRAAALRSAAETAGKHALPPALVERRAPFIERGFEPAAALAWAVAGFSPKEAMAWGAAGIAIPDQAQAWRDRGIDADEAACWAEMDLLPDEAAAFKACGADSPDTARQLRRVLGDVEHLLAWHRAGFEVAEVLRVHAAGTRSVAEAIKQREAEELKARSITSFFQTPAKPPRAKTEPAVPGNGEAAGGRRPSISDDPVESTASLRIKAQSGGAWLGWAMPAAADAELSQGDGADLLEIGGLRLGVVSASEGVALPGQAYDPPTISVKDGWQARLDGLSDALGTPRASGRWTLHAWAPFRAWLFWGLVYRSAAVPWGQTIDFESHETWQQRWARKTAEFGDDKLKCPVKVGRTAGGGWWIGLTPSIIGSKGARPEPIEPVAMQPAWRDAMSDFCLKMGIGSQAAAWHLLAGDEKEPDEG